jgi:hypothetical protein
MLVTEVDMLMWNANRDETAKMMQWLARDETFLFDFETREHYGFTGFEDEGFYCDPSWYRENITVQMKRRTSRFIDFRFTLNTYTYPKSLVTILHQLGWKVKSRWREGWIDGPVDETRVIRWRAWNQRCDSGFPLLWDAGLDRARQEGMLMHHDRL